jgi:ribosomal-protein-alanine N-acetyltransferase
VLSVLHHDERVMATLGGIRSDEETRAFLDHKTGHWARFGYGMWMFNHRATGEFVGRGGLQKIVIGGNLEIEVGYTLRADYFGQGYGTEMARGIVDVATRELGLSDLVAFTLPDNAASRRVMEKSGFAYERTLMHEGEEHVLYRLVPPAETTGSASPSPRTPA